MTATSVDTIDTWKPVVVTAYDYYPFGEYMPGRYFSETNSHCFTTTQVELVHVVYYTPLIAWPAYTSGTIVGTGGSVITPWSGTTTTDMMVTASDANEGFTYDVTGITPGFSTELTINTDSTITGTFTATLTDDSTGKLIGAIQLFNTQGQQNVFPLPFTGISSSATLSLSSLSGGSVIIIPFIGIPHDTLEPENVVTTVCEDEWYRYSNNGMLKVNEIAGLGNHYAPLHGEFTPQNGQRWNKDEWNKNPSISPYATFDDNPIWKKDPLGDDPSTDVTKQSDGNYKVVGGKADGDKNIYVDNDKGQRTGETIGQSLTPNSFLGDNGKAVVGATINPNDQSGANFLNNEIMGKSMGLTDYMKNAGNGGIYDFKDRGIGGKPASESKEQYRYRGMPVDGVNGLGGGDKPTFASGRDIGNVGAGYEAGAHGLPWAAARLGFDAYQNRNTSPLKWQSEGPTTQQAEKAGFNVGQSVFKVQYHEDVKRIQQFDAQRTYPWGPK